MVNVQAANDNFEKVDKQIRIKLKILNLPKVEASVCIHDCALPFEVAAQATVRGNLARRILQ